METDITDLMINLDLRDIHLPDGVSWWPLPIIWWIVPVFIAILFIFLRQWKKRKTKSLRSIALQNFNELKMTQKQDSEYFLEVYLLLRRICNALPGGSAYARNTDGQWLVWLSNQCGLAGYSENLKKQIRQVPYQPPQVADNDELIELATTIINKLPERPLKDLSDVT